MKKLIILHIIDVHNQKGNGVSNAVKEYAKTEKDIFNVAIYDLTSQLVENETNVFFNSKYDSISKLPAPFNKPDLVIFNEIYKPKYIKLYKECLKKSIKYIIIPHGSLVYKAQSKKKLKKRLANLLLFNKFISSASAIQFLNTQEKEYSNFKYKKGIILSNGINTPSANNNKAIIKNFVFIGRYDIYVKGLDLIIDMVGNNLKWFKENDVIINLYGRITSNNTMIEMKKIINKNNATDIVRVNDAIYGEEKVKVLNNSYAFIQTSRHEGQPMGIIEAMSYGVPCIVTTGTSFSDIVNLNKCGFGVEFDINELFEAIKKISNDINLRNQMSNNSFNYAKKAYDWSIIKENITKEYKLLVTEKK